MKHNSHLDYLPNSVNLSGFSTSDQFGKLITTGNILSKFGNDVNYCSSYY